MQRMYVTTLKPKRLQRNYRALSVRLRQKQSPKPVSDALVIFVFNLPRIFWLRVGIREIPTNRLKGLGLVSAPAAPNE